MKNSKLALLGTSAALVLLSFARPAYAAPARSAGEWLNHYYENPQPDQFVPAIYELSRNGYFEQPGHVSQAIGFIAGVFSRNPEQIDQWVVNLGGLPAPHQRLIAAALWYSGSPKGAEYLRAYSRVVNRELRAEIDGLLVLKPSLRETDVLSASSLNLQWGAFLATGDSRHIQKVLAALGSEEPGLNAAVLAALAEKAVAHERVYEICQAELARQPAGLRDQMRTALAEAKPQP